MSSAMSVKIGTVVRTTDGKAVVRMDCELSCGKDHATCPLNVLLYGGTRPRFEEVEAENPLHAGEGDIVNVGASSGKITAGIFSVYGALFLSLAVSILVGYLAMSLIAAGKIIVIGGAALLGIGLAAALLRFLDKRYQPGYRVMQILYSKKGAGEEKTSKTRQRALSKTQNTGGA